MNGFNLFSFLFTFPAPMTYTQKKKSVSQKFYTFSQCIKKMKLWAGRGLPLHIWASCPVVHSLLPVSVSHMEGIL